MKFIDLFCGVGGFHQALRKLGHECVLACDIDEKCREVYEDNYNIKPEKNVIDIDTSKIEDFDILTGGFPCQPFSNAGKKKSFDDDRGNLFMQIVRIAVDKSPKFLFLENVKHIKRISEGRVMTYILNKLDEIGYKVQVVELSPHQLGVPQQRERVVFICVRKDIYTEDIDLHLDPNIECDFSTIFETDESITAKYKVKQDVSNVLHAWDEIIQQFEENQKMSPMILAHEIKKEYTEAEFSKLPAWKKDCIEKNKVIYAKYKGIFDSWIDETYDLLSKRQIYSQLDWQAGPLKENDSIFDHFIQIRQSGVRVKKTKYFPTLVAIVQTPIYGKEERYLTPRECARLQSFPDTFKLHKTDQVSYKQFGNAVNVDVVHKVIYETLKIYT